MRIAYLADAASIHTRRWASHFARQGHEVCVFSFLPGKIEGVAVSVLNAGRVATQGGNWHYLLVLPKLRRQLHRWQPDLVHAHYLTSYGLLGALCGLRPLAMTAWGTDVLVTPGSSILYRSLLRFTLGCADLVTSDADVMSQELLRHGLPPGRLLTVPLGVDRRVFNADGRCRRASGRRLISTRQLVPNSNLQVLLAAMALAQASLPELVLDIAGAGPERDRLQTVAHGLGLDSAIVWHGALDHHLLPPLLRTADIYLSLTLSDSTSVSLLEAMACGVLPIVSDLPANREWIADGINGLLVRPDDVEGVAEAILRSVSDASLRRRAADHNADLVAERADWDKNMEQVGNCYRALIQRRA